MAKYHENLKHHEDDVTKHKITDEELQFLSDLQKELNTQDYVSQADPRFWVIKGSEKIYHVEDDVDGYELYDPDGCVVVASDTIEAYEYINDNLLEDINKNRLDGEEFTIIINENNLLGVIWVDGDKEDYREPKELTDLHEIQKWLEEQGYNYEIIAYKLVQKIYENTMFLTQIDAENHLRANAHHYSEDAHTFAMTAWRDWRMDKLIKILQQVDFSR